MTPPATPAWLPAALLLANYPDLAGLEVAAYAVFQRDWTTRPVFRGDEVRVHRHLHLANPNRWNTYWHCVTEGEPETTRTAPIAERLERIPWSRPVIENETDTAAGIKVWANIRGRDQHVCIWLEPQNYLVVLKIAYDHFVLKTTYCPESRRRMQLQRDYNAWKKRAAPFERGLMHLPHMVVVTTQYIAKIGPDARPDFRKMQPPPKRGQSS